MIMANCILLIPRTGHLPESALREYLMTISGLHQLAYMLSIRLARYILLMEPPAQQPRSGSVGITLKGYRSLSTNADSLYFADGGSLYTLNTSTGAATLIGPSGVSLTALLQENGTLYGASYIRHLSVDTVDPATGAATIWPRYYRCWRHVCHWARAVSGGGAGSVNRPWPPGRSGPWRRIVWCQAVAAEPEASFVWRRYPTRNSMIRLSNVSTPINLVVASVSALGGTNLVCGSRHPANRWHRQLGRAIATRPQLAQLSLEPLPSPFSASASSDFA